MDGAQVARNNHALSISGHLCSRQVGPSEDPLPAKESAGAKVSLAIDGASSIGTTCISARRRSRLQRLADPPAHRQADRHLFDPSAGTLAFNAEEDPRLLRPLLATSQR